MNSIYQIRNNDRTLSCTLCPHRCRLKENEYGRCNVRICRDGNIISTVYGLASALHLDPIEKKPLYHFHPGRKVLSLGSFGCNMRCNFCQNHHISQVRPVPLSGGYRLSPEEIAAKAASIEGNIGVAYTYNEPVVWYEYMADTAMLIRKEGLKNIMVSNGYISKRALEDLIPLIDAYNIDLKAFDEGFYREQTGSTLKPVLNTIKTIAERGKHLEITMLVIPGLNDDIGIFKEMLAWINDNCGRDTVLHLSKYFPNYQSDIRITPDRTLLELYYLAKKTLDRSYLGNTTLKTGRPTSS